MRNKPKLLFIYFILIIGIILIGFPYLYVMISSTQTNAEILSPTINLSIGPHFIDNITHVIERHNYIRVLMNTAIISVIGTILSTFISTLAGYVLAKYKFKGNNFIFNLVMLSRMLPGFVTLIPVFYILSRLGLTNTLAGVIVPGIASSTSVFIMRQYAKQFPTELIEASRIDGASEMTIFWKVAVPVLMPSIFTTALLTFMGYWNAYLLPLILLSNPQLFTVPLIIQNMTQLNTEPINYGALMSVLFTSVIPLIVIYMFVQAKFKSTGLEAAIK